MQFYSAKDVARALSYEALVTKLRESFVEGAVVPPRSMLPVELPSGARALFALMPAWQEGRTLSVKLVTIFPDNPARGLPTIHAQILLFDGATGIPQALVDGTEVTRRRTAAVSALAATYLAREDARSLLLIGTGAQAPHNALALAAVRPIDRIGVWGRSVEKARAVVSALAPQTRCKVQLVDDLEKAAREADVISCATSASTPLVQGAWLKPGAHLDLVGSHSPNARECDDEAARRAKIYVDTMAGALREAGDVLMPIRAGVIREADVIGDLRGLCRGEIEGRRSAGEITLFKSVGSGLADLAAAQLVVSCTGAR